MPPQQSKEIEIEKIQTLLKTEKNLDKITFYEGYLKGLLFQESHPQEDWKEEFRKLWNASFDRDGGENCYEYDRLVSFISQLLATAKEEARKDERERIKIEIESMAQPLSIIMGEWNQLETFVRQKTILKLLNQPK